MFVVQMRTKNGANKTTGGDFFEVSITGPEVCGREGRRERGRGKGEEREQREEEKENRIVTFSAGPS